MDYKVPEQNNFTQTKLSIPKYKHITIYPESNPTLTQAASVDAVFEIPSANILNLGKSILEFTLSATAQLNDFVFLHAGITPVTKIQLLSQQGVPIYELQNVQEYMRVSLPVTTDRKDWENQADITQDATTSWCPSNELASAVTSQYITNAGGVASSSKNYLCPTSLRSSGANNTAIDIDFSLPLSHFRHLFLDKDLYFGGEALRLTVTFSGWQNFGFDADDAPLANQGALVAASFTSNPVLQLAVQQNPDIQAGVKNAVLSSGMRIPICNVVGKKITTDNSTSFVDIFKVNSGHGRKLLMCYTALLSNSADALKFNHDNTANAKWSTHRNALDSVYFQDGPYSMLQYYKRYYDECYKDTIYYNPLEFSYRPTIVMNFTGIQPCELYKNEANINSGLDLTVEKQILTEWVKTGAAYQYWIFAVTQRYLYLNANGVQVANA